MEAIQTGLVTYVITIVISLCFAGLLVAVARGIKHLDLKGDPQLPINTSPPPSSAPDLAPVAIAIVAAHHRAASQ
jgi:hypothetical protein